MNNIKNITMKQFVILINFLIICNLPFSTFAQKKTTSKSKKALNYQITFQLPGIPDSILYIANYYGNHTYLRDSLRPLKKNPYTFVFQGSDTLKRGVYILASQANAKYMEFIVDSSFFFTVQSEHLEPPVYNIANNVKFINSPENDLFYQFTGKMVGWQIEGRNLSKKFKEEQAKTSPNQEYIDELKKQMRITHDSMQEYTLRFIEENPNNLFAKAQKLTQEVEVPDEKPQQYQDSNWQYQYYAEHYWDNCDFNDNAMIYTPVFAPRLAQYYENVIHPSVDSIIKYTDILIEKSKNSYDIYKYIIWYTSNRFEQSKYLGHDAIFVHLIRTYYEKGLCPWIDETVLERMIDRANTLEPILLGKTAPWLIMPDVDGKFHTNYDFTTDYTIMYFWDTDCGHCKVTTPKLLELYNRAKDSLNFDVYAVCLTSDSVEWKNYLAEKKLPWINVGNNKANIDFRDAYDINSSPKIFILDRNKKIILKNIGIEEVEDFLIKHRQGLIKF